MEILAAHSALAGAEALAIRQIIDCVTVEAAIEVMKRYGVNDFVWESIGQKAGFHLNERTKGRVAIKYIIFTEEHGVLVEKETGGVGQ
jgi:cobalt-precorrin-5B (C1)-methyltransferase